MDVETKPSEQKEKVEKMDEEKEVPTGTIVEFINAVFLQDESAVMPFLQTVSKCDVKRQPNNYAMALKSPQRLKNIYLSPIKSKIAVNQSSMKEPLMVNTSPKKFFKKINTAMKPPTAVKKKLEFDDALGSALAGDGFNPSQPGSNGSFGAMLNQQLQPSAQHVFQIQQHENGHAGPNPNQHLQSPQRHHARPHSNHEGSATKKAKQEGSGVGDALALLIDASFDQPSPTPIAHSSSSHNFQSQLSGSLASPKPSQLSHSGSGSLNLNAPSQARSNLPPPSPSKHHSQSHHFPPHSPAKSPKASPAKSLMLQQQQQQMQMHQQMMMHNQPQMPVNSPQKFPNEKNQQLYHSVLQHQSSGGIPNSPHAKQQFQQQQQRQQQLQSAFPYSHSMLQAQNVHYNPPLQAAGTLSNEASAYSSSSAPSQVPVTALPVNPNLILPQTNQSGSHPASTLSSAAVLQASQQPLQQAPESQVPPPSMQSSNSTTS